MRDDIERPRVDQACRESDARFRRLAENSPDIIYHYELVPKRRFTYINPATTSLVGYTPHDHYADPNLLAKIVHPDDRSLLSAIGRGVCRPEPFPLRLYHKDGHLVWIEVHNVPVIDSTGQVVAIEGVGRNVTRRVRAETRVHLHASRASTLAEISQALAHATLNLHDGLAIVARRIAELVGDACVVRLLSPDGRWLQTAAIHHTDETALALLRDSAVPFRRRADEGIFGQVLRTGEPVLLTDVSSAQVCALGIAEQGPYLERHGVSSLLLVALHARGRVQGVAGLARDAKAPPYSLDDQIFVRELADHAALAIANALLHAEVRDSRAELQTLSRRLVELQEAERHTIARELHDEIGQQLTGLKLLLGNLDRSDQPPSRTRVRRGSSTGDAVALVDHVLAQVRSLARGLRPAMLDDLGLLPTLHWQFEDYSAQTSVRVCFQHAGLDRRFAAPVELAAFRIVQEALTNAARHAGVDEVSVMVRAEDGQLRLAIVDAGRGFDFSTVRASRLTSGLAGMQERAALLGGAVTVTSAPDAGTRILAELPCSPVWQRDRVPATPVPP
ncbi:MAG: GAF domain-containing protein [Chloroflexi bacterium]|nr:GAF domain-containing protein [Chloroflexota bacterium]